MDIRPHPYRMRSYVHGISHGLKSVPRTLFAPVCPLVPPFRFRFTGSTNKKRPPIGWPFFIGGADGNRTHVRKQLGRNFSGRSLLFTFPHPGGNKHPTGISSFMMHGMGKAYHTHVLHSNDTRARLVDLPGRMRA